MAKIRRDPVGLKDIADRTGLSVMSVSRALRGVKGVSPETRDEVVRIAGEMGYVRNTLAGNLVQGTTRTVGVVVPDFESSIFHKGVQVIEAFLGEHDYTLLLSCAFDEPEREARQVQALLERRVDGIIIAPASSTMSRTTVEKILQSQCPVVLVDRLVHGMNVHSVTFNDYEGAFEIVSHLIEQGYDKIAHIGGPENIWTADERIRGYKEALHTHGLKFRPEYMLRSGFRVEHGMAMADRMLMLKERPDAVFCVNDPTAIGVLKTFIKRGIKVPDMVAIAGFSDTVHADILKVPITTMIHDAEIMGRQAANMMLSLMHSADWRKLDPIHQEFKTHIVVRKSTLRKKK